MKRLRFVTSQAVQIQRVFVVGSCRAGSNQTAMSVQDRNACLGLSYKQPVNCELHLNNYIVQA